MNEESNEQRRLGLESLLVGGIAAEGITQGRRRALLPLVNKSHGRLPAEVVHDGLARNVSRRYVPDIRIVLGPQGTSARMDPSGGKRVVHFGSRGNIPTLFHEVGHARQGRAAFSRLFGTRLGSASVRLTPLLAAQATITEDPTERNLAAGAALVASVPSAARLGREFDAWGRGWSPYKDYQRALGRPTSARPYIRAAGRALPGYLLASPLTTIPLGVGAGKLWTKAREARAAQAASQSEKTAGRRPSFWR